MERNISRAKTRRNCANTTDNHIVDGAERVAMIDVAKAFYGSETYYVSKQAAYAEGFIKGREYTLGELESSMDLVQQAFDDEE